MSFTRVATPPPIPIPRLPFDTYTFTMQIENSSSSGADDKKQMEGAAKKADGVIPSHLPVGLPLQHAAPTADRTPPLDIPKLSPGSSSSSESSPHKKTEGLSTSPGKGFHLPSPRAMLSHLFGPARSTDGQAIPLSDSAPVSYPPSEVGTPRMIESSKIGQEPLLSSSAPDPNPLKKASPLHMRRIISPRSRRAHTILPAAQTEMLQGASSPSQVRFADGQSVSKTDEKKRIEHKLRKVSKSLQSSKRLDLDALVRSIVRCYVENSLGGTLIVKKLSEIFEKAYKKRPSDAEELLHKLFLQKKFLPLFPSLLNKIKIDLNIYAKSCVKYHFEQIACDKLDQMLLVNLLIHHSKMDVENQSKIQNQGAVLFREASFAAFLYAHYGNQMESDSLTNLKEFILKQFVEIGPEQIQNFRIDPMGIRKQLESDPHYLGLNLAEKENFVNGIALKNTEFFKCFSTKVLEFLFSLQFSEQFRLALDSRRDQIIKTLDAQHSSAPSSSTFSSESYERSRPLMGNAIMLRLINPYILSLVVGLTEEEQSILDSLSLNERWTAVEQSIFDSLSLKKWRTEVEQSILESLIKVIQNLSNEVPFGEKVRDPILEELNPLYQYFLPQSQAFIDRCCQR